MENTRKPNKLELDELTYAHIKAYTVDLENSIDLIKSAYISVFDNYTTDCPGYRGKVFSVIYSGGPEFYDVFIQDKENGGLTLVKKEG